MVSLLGGLDTSRSNKNSNNTRKDVSLSQVDDMDVTDDIAQLLLEAEQIVAEVDSLFESSINGVEEIEAIEKSNSESTEIRQNEFQERNGSLKNDENKMGAAVESNEKLKSDKEEKKVITNLHDQEDHTIIDQQAPAAAELPAEEEIKQVADQLDEVAEAEPQLSGEMERVEEQDKMARNAWEAEENATRLEEEARRAEIEYLLEEANIAKEAQESKAELRKEEVRHMEKEKVEQDAGFSKASLTETTDLIGKFVTQRNLYRFSPTQNSGQSPFAIEERQCFQVMEDQNMKRIGEKSIIIRGFDAVEESAESITKSDDESRKLISVGPPLYSANGLDDMSFAATGSMQESDYAIALYCMANPDIIQGEGMQLGSGAGFAGIMSVIGAGLASTFLKNNDKLISDVKNGTIVTPSPQKLSTILLTDSRGDLLDKCVQNLRACSFPSSKVEIGLLDWSRKTPTNFRDKFDFILGSDCPSDPRNVNPLVRTVAFSLKSSPYDKRKTKQTICGKFVHIGQGKAESFVGLKERLSTGYKMHSKLDEMILERVILIPLVADSLEDASDSTQLNTAGGPVEYRSVESSTYSALIAHHDQDYNGVNGDIVFQSGVFI